MENVTVSRATDIISTLKQFFGDDQISLYYSGEFDDQFTEQLVHLSEHDSSKAIKKRLSYLMTESFQNVVRHGKEPLSKQAQNIFGVRGVAPFLSIFSSNQVEENVKEKILGNVSELNDMNQDELKEYYVNVLEGEGFSDKGGAGLGLVDMIRKSKMPLQVSFDELESGIHSFSMQIDLLTDKEQDPTRLKPSIPIEENTSFYTASVDKEIVFAYKGAFNDSFIAPMLKVLEGNSEIKDEFGFELNHCIVEMMQNVARHGTGQEEGSVGMMAMSKTDNGYYICTGNYTNLDCSGLEAWVNEVNEMYKEQLDSSYQSRLKESLKHDTNNAGVGIIDIRRVTGNPIDYELREDEKGSFVIFGAEIN